MSQIKIWLGSLVSFVSFVAIVFFIVGASAALPTHSSVVRADTLPACTATGVTCIGDVEIFNASGFSGTGSGGGCGMGATVTVLNNANGAGLELSGIGGNTTCNLTTSTGGTFSTSASFEVAGINGYLLDDQYVTFNCGISGGTTSGTGAFNPGLGAASVASVSCPSLPLGTTTQGTASSTFAATDLLTETLTLSGSSVGPGAISLTSLSAQFSVVPAVTTPEPSSLLLLGAGLLWLVAIKFARKEAQTTAV